MFLKGRIGIILLVINLKNLPNPTPSLPSYASLSSLSLRRFPFLSLNTAVPVNHGGVRCDWWLLVDSVEQWEGNELDSCSPTVSADRSVAAARSRGGEEFGVCERWSRRGGSSAGTCVCPLRLLEDALHDYLPRSCRGGNGFTSGLLLITGPYKINGVPLRRVNQAFVIGTSTKVDISGVNVDKFNYKYFAKAVEKKKTKSESEFFESEKEEKTEIPTERKDDQKALDAIPDLNFIDCCILRNTSQEEAIKQEETLRNEVACLRGDLQQVRDDRDRQLKQVQSLLGEVVEYKECTGKSIAELDSLTTKTNGLDQLAWLKVRKYEDYGNNLLLQRGNCRLSDISAMETRSELHNTILELKWNIRVFCRVRPLLSDDGARTDTKVVSFPTSMEALRRGIDLAQKDIFLEISQLVQSALEGLYLCLRTNRFCKTYTMMGKPGLADQKGLIPRSLQQVFETRQILEAQGWKYEMQVSMLEIYSKTNGMYLIWKNIIRSNDIDDLRKHWVVCFTEVQ
ncbi:hypothetical protein CASFOL_033490 [Castilleja foliolosa]|uniref:Kinesin motor domain-containing protein n=1 Tax=Castilleja foliolosa TaxID=1961234 RepID=A0ABD3BYU5_9LAMI